MEIGIATFSWEFKAKYGVISGLLSSYLIAYLGSAEKVRPRRRGEAK